MRDDTKGKKRAQKVDLTSALPRDVDVTGSVGVILISPDSAQRRMLATALAQHRARVVMDYPLYPSIGSLEGIAGLGCDAVLVDVDADVGAALALVEAISRNSAITVMVYSRISDADLLMRCMRAGAREFLYQAKLDHMLAEALRRAATRRLELSEQKKARGKVLAFCGAKGGVGVTTLATNFAIALRRETGEDVALADLSVHLGQVSVLLGITPRFTLLDAFRNAERLDGEFLAGLMAEHASGVKVLPSSDEYGHAEPVQDGVLGRLFNLLKQQYAYAVVDAGPVLAHGAETLFEAADSLYVVAQLDIPSLRNAQRFIAYRKRAGDSVEVVLNRFEPRKLEYDEDKIAKVLGMAPRWRVPNDYAAVRRQQNTGTPLSTQNSPVARCLAEMARAASGKPVEQRKKKKGFLGLSL